jgi:hypothetical protein
MAEKNALILAPGVVFNEARHEYHLRGKQLSGVTGIIGKRLGTKFPEEFVGEARGEGLHVHKAVEDWIDARGRTCNSMHPGVMWITGTLIDKCTQIPKFMHSEVLVSDLTQYASAVDIIAEYDGKILDLFDMKRSFKRTPVTWQLSIYKYFIETFTPYRVDKLWCAAFRDKEYYPIFPKDACEIEELLYGKKDEK